MTRRQTSILGWRSTRGARRAVVITIAAGISGAPALDSQSALASPALGSLIADQARTTAQARGLPVVRIRSSGGTSIVAVVGDDIITAYDVDVRIGFLLLSSPDIANRMRSALKDPSINDRFRKFATARRPTSQAQVKALQKEFVGNIRAQVLRDLKPRMRKAALEELIEERIKLAEAKRLGVSIPEDDVKRAVKSISDKNKMTEAQFAAHLRGLGADVSVIQSRLRSALAWREVIRHRFGPLISITQKEIDTLVSTNPGDSDTVELRIHRITLAVPKGRAQDAAARRFKEAEGIKQRFRGCNTTASLAKSTPDARFEDLGYRSATSFPEPTRSLLTGARDGEIATADLSQTGVEIYIVCGRKTAKVDDKKREEAQQQLQAREFENYSKRHLRDLRQETRIEYR